MLRLLYLVLIFCLTGCSGNQAKNTEGLIEENLSQYGINGSLEQAIAEMLGCDLGEVKVLAGDPTQGLSGNPIYLVDSCDGRELIVKVFPNSFVDFSKELTALSTYGDLGLKQVKFPEVIAIGVYEDGADRKYLLAEGKVKGELVSKIMIKYLKNGDRSPEKGQAQNRLLGIHRTLGRGLAELHTAGNPVKAKMGKAYAEAYSRSAENGTKEIIKRDPSRKKLAEEKLALFKRLMEGRGEKPYGYIHGDAHYGNYFWDEGTKTLSMIDVTDGGSSIGLGRKPVGCPMIDIARVVTDLTNWSLWGLPVEEAELFREAFLEGYREIDSSLKIDSPEFRLFQMINAYQFFEWFGSKSEYFPRGVYNRLNPIWEHYLELFEEIHE